MEFHVRPESPVPIFEQIITRLTYAIAAGELPVGEVVPSVRVLARQLIVNPNTVTKAFAELERLGMLESRRGLGMAVTSEAPKLAAAQRKQIVRRHLHDALCEALHAQFTPDEIHQFIDEEWGRLNGQPRRGNS